MSESASARVDAPADGETLNAPREERLRLLVAELAIGTPSAKHFDVDEMRCLRDDMAALLGEIDRLRAQLTAARSDREDAAERLRAAWRGQDITHGHMERFANETIIADMLFDYFADWLDWGSLRIQRQHADEPVTADLVVGPKETPRAALLREALANGSPEFVAKLRGAIAARRAHQDKE